jgi:1-acyl-sn-glycerol-3-phosphate acyltransferase
MYPLYDLAHAIFFVLFKLLFGYRITGRENVPKTGGVILASNHASYLDPPLVGTGVGRRVNFMAKEELFNRPWKRFVLNSWKAIPVRREQLDKSVLKVVLARLNSGEVVGLFPEGTRSPDGELMAGKAGIGMIVSMAKVPVVPVYISGSHQTMSKMHKGFRPCRISVTYGKPVEFTRSGKEAGHERYQRIADMIMEEIKKLKDNEAKDK